MLLQYNGISTILPIVLLFLPKEALNGIKHTWQLNLTIYSLFIG